MRILSQVAAAAVDTAPAPAHDARILVFDTDEGVARTIGAILRHDGYQVATASSIFDALVRLRDERFDLVLLELRAEDSGGDYMLARLRDMAPDTAVVVLTRYATFESALRALRESAYDYLVKPVDVDELRITVERATQM